jgi:uncharacterized protein (DUF736 family)
MPAIGRVTKHDDGSYSGHLATLSIRKNIELVPNNKTADHQPDFIVMAGDVEVGAAWNRIGQASGKDYVSISLAAPEFGDRTLYANLGKPAGSKDKNEFAIIWNPNS